MAEFCVQSRISLRFHDRQPRLARVKFDSLSFRTFNLIMQTIAFPIFIKNIQEPIIYNYFSSLNESDFDGVADLFAVDGYLHPPFERVISGRAAICKYLQAEAKGIEAFPESGTIVDNPDGAIGYQIAGRVKVGIFVVNVRWSIELNAQCEIAAVTIKLLAELQDLLPMKRD